MSARPGPPPAPAAMTVATVPTPVSDATGNRTIFGIDYAVIIGYRPVTLDLHLPPEALTPAPVVVYLHGGGWQQGSRANVGIAYADWAPTPFARLTAQGFAVAAVDYRLSGEAIWPAQLDDAVAAVHWLRTHGDELGLDTTQIVLWGESAGAHLAATAALLGDDPRGAGDVVAVVDWYGPADLDALAEQSGPGALVDPGALDSREARLLGSPPGTDPARTADASPIHHVTSSAPPFLIIHGTGDRFVPHQQSVDLAAALRAAGTDVILDLVDGADHMWMDSAESANHAFDRTVDYLRQRLTTHLPLSGS